ncbi:hypothetical protein RCO48_16925 [Peribacillus frigoritolerans]|nr:hypothetical protein [Peribacillus frigoritolerans]
MKKIDAVYYVDYDVEKIAAGKDSWDSIFKTCCINLGEIIYFMIEIIFSYSIIGRDFLNKVRFSYGTKGAG